MVTGSIGLYVATLLASGGNISMGGFTSFLAPSTLSLFLFGASGATPVFEYGRWWTVLSAGWLHAGVLHILFNMLWVRQLGPACAEMYGAGRMVIIYVLASVMGFVASSTAGVLLAWMPIYLPARRGVHGRRVGRHLRPAGGARCTTAGAPAAA